MKKTFEVLDEVCEVNPSLTHFLLRLYKNKKGLVAVEDEDFRYEVIGVAMIPKIEKIIADFEEGGWSVGLTSMVITTEGIQHLLMLDYLVDQSGEAEGDIAWKLSTFNQSGDASYKMDGYLIKTNQSYHYLGKYITTEESFINFLGSALLFRHSGENYIIDDIWLGRSIKRRFGAIRLGQKKGEYPVVIGEIK